MKSQTLDYGMPQIHTWNTFAAVLRRHAQDHSPRPAITSLDAEGVEDQNFTYAELDQRARAIGAFLQKERMQGQRALLLLPSGSEFISVFLGCLYAGVIAVPAFPFHFEGSQRGQSWFRGVAADAEPRIAFATSEMIARLPKAEDNPLVRSIQWICPQSIGWSWADDWREPDLAEETIAFLQYTSGSTSSPKGVIISHRNLLHNMKVIQAACGTDEDSTVVTWLPLYHDMGLIGTVLQPLYLGAPCVLMEPSTFLQKPLRWLQAISKYRAHSSSAPNFAYELCARKISQDDKAGLELSSWRVAVNGAEPVRPETIKRFVSAFSQCGFRAEAFHPSYGLAEATLMVTGGSPTNPPTLLRLSAEALERNLVREPSGNEPARVLVGCGAVLSGQQLKIVDPETCEQCQNGRVGEIWVSSPSIAQGYWNRPEETTKTFQAQLVSAGDAYFLRTGDLGFLAENELFITGRLKDLIILRGRNLYPHDIELTVQQSYSSLRPGSGAAFTIEIHSEELLVVVNEVDRHLDVSHEALIAKIRNAVLLEHGIQIYSLMLLKPGTVPKTTSGKIKRAASRAAFLAGEFQALASSTLPLDSLEPALAGASPRRTELLQIEPGLRIQWVESHLRQQVAQIAKIDPREISSDRPLIGFGLDSLGATELAGRVETGLGARLDVASLLEGVCLARLAGMIVDQMSLAEETPTVPKVSPVNKSWPLSHGQKGLWILHKIAPNSVAYTLSSAIRVAGRLDFNALEKAFLQLMQRHEMFRAVFSAASGEPMQVIQSMQEISIAQHLLHIDLSQIESDRWHDRLAQEAQIAFSLEEAPPVRLVVLGLPTGDDVLMLLLHHIIADLWSIDIILQELGSVYLAHHNSHPVSLPQLHSTYLDFTSWQSHKLERSGESLLNYWHTQLSGEVPVLQLPADRARPPVFSYRGATEGLSLGVHLYHKLQSIARRENVTPFMLLVGVFQLLLHRICAQDDVLLGSPVSGRNKPDFAGVVGYFVNPIVLRSHYDGSLLFGSYLAQVRHTILQAFRHQDYPFPLLVEQLHPRREGGVSTLFQAMFVWQELPGSQGEALAAASLGEARIPVQFAGASAELVPLENSGAQFDLTLLMSPTAAGLFGALKYSADLFDPTTIQRLGNQFSVLLTAVTEDFQQQLSSLSLMSPAERGQLLSRFSMGRPTPSTGQAFIHELFERHAEADPSAIALIAGERQITFAQLNAQANQFARYLQSLGVKPESLVGVCLQRSSEFIAALLGIWKSGGVYVPFDAYDPQPRLAAMMERASLSALITHEHLLDRLPEQLPPVVLLDLDLDLIAQESDSNLNIALGGRNLAYVIHTSGSTGTPKGVMIEHRCLKNLLDGLSGSIYASHNQRLIVALNAPFTFDSSIKQLITLAMGHTLCLIPEEIRRNGPELLVYIKEMRLDVFDCTPTQVQLLLEAGLEEAADSATLLIAGEPIPEPMWNILRNRSLRTSYNLYGPTECAVDATVCRIGSEPDCSIGRPLSGTSIYILDELLEAVPEGVPGEIFIGGHSVGRGYLDRPDLTAEKFLPDLFSAEAGSRMYRTGDRARWSSNGTIRFIGRVDRQVKSRGFRIEPGEIEAALRAQSGVQDAAIVARNLGGGATQLVGYVIAAQDKPSNHYRQLLARVLPDYMLPVVIVTLAGIPLTAHGKKDYSALPIPDMAELARNDMTPPESPLEEYLVNLWTSVLRVQPIGIHDNFFSLGGDSLQATKLITQIQQEYPSDMPLLALFFQEPTIASLARFIDARSEAPADSAVS